MIAVVSDTSPINYLVQIGLVELLRELYETVLLPPEVVTELVSASAPLVVREWASDLPSWVLVRQSKPEARDDPRWRRLDIGERAALAIADEFGGLLLIDERAGCSIAKQNSIRVTGTLGVLDEAARRQLILLSEAAELLKKTSFRYPAAIVNRLLAEEKVRTGS